MKRWLVWAGIVLLSVLAILLAGLFAVDAHRRAKAEALVWDIRALRIGESTSADVERLVRQYGVRTDLLRFAPEDCSPPNCEDVLFVVESPFSRGVDNYPFWIGTLRLWVWIVRAGVRLENGRVSETGAAVFTRRPDSCWLFAGTSLRKDISRKSETMPEFDDSDEHIERYMYNVQGGLLHIDPEHGDVLKSELTPQASAAAREHAFNLNWKCLGTLTGCKELCELYPEVWADWIADQKKRGTDLTPTQGRTCAVPGGACVCHGGCEDPK